MEISKATSGLINTPAAILNELMLSKENGNVVGIWTSAVGKSSTKVVCLTAVEDVIDIEIMNDKLIILKKLDLQGIYLTDNEIYLSEIERVVTFNTSYNEHLMWYLQQPIDDPTVKIRLREQSVTIDDLKIILIRNLNSGNKIQIKKTNEIEVSRYYLSDFNSHTDTVVVSDKINNDSYQEISIKDIDSIEFEFHYDYKGFSTKIFTVHSPINLSYN